VTGSAGVRHLVLVRHSRRDELEGVGTDERPRHTFCLDLRHVTTDARTPRTADFVMSVLFQRRGMRTIGGARAVAIETEFAGGLPQLWVIVSAVNIVAGRAGDAAAVHHALDEVVALHPILVCSAIGEVQEIRLPKRDVFELPVVYETKADVIPNRPVVGFAFDEARSRPTLGVALNAGVG